MATWPAKINYATGDVLTAAQMNDIGGELNDLYNSYGKAAGKNAVINGGFDIWQRGTSVAVTASSTAAYQADRWQGYRGATGATISRQATGDTTNLPNIQYCARVQRDSGNTATNFIQIANNFETVNSIPFAGKTVTFSFYARAGANFSATSNALTVNLCTGTGTDQNVTAAYTGIATPVNTTATLTTTWQRFIYTVTLATNVTEIATVVYYTPTGTAGAADYFEITGVQLELGSTATPFSRAGGTIQGELAACQRYYFRNTGSANYERLGLGSATSTTAGQIIVRLPVSMRANQSSIDYSTLALYDGANTPIALTNLTLDTASPNTVTVAATVASGLTQYRPYQLVNNNSTSGYLGFSAEL